MNYNVAHYVVENKAWLSFFIHNVADHLSHY